MIAINDNIERPDRRILQYVTVLMGDQLFGLPIERVQDVFLPERVTRVPLAAPEIVGVLNLRGRVVTAVDLRLRLGLPAGPADGQPMAVGIEWRGESYGLLVDTVGEVLKLPEDMIEPIPANLDRQLAPVATGIYRLEKGLLVILDVDRVLDDRNRSRAA